MTIPPYYIIPYYDKDIKESFTHFHADFFIEGNVYDIHFPNNIESFRLIKILDDSLIVKSISENNSRLKFSLTYLDCNNLGVPYVDGLEIFPKFKTNEENPIWYRHNEINLPFDAYDLSTYPSDTPYDYYIDSILIKISGFKVQNNVVHMDWSEETLPCTLFKGSFIIENTIPIGDSSDLTHPYLPLRTFKYSIVTNYYAHCHQQCNSIDVDGNVFLRLWLNRDDSKPINPKYFHHLTFDDVFKVSCVTSSETDTINKYKRTSRGMIKISNSRNMYGWYSTYKATSNIGVEGTNMKNVKR